MLCIFYHNFFKKERRGNLLFLTKGGEGHLQMYESEAPCLTIFLSYLTTNLTEAAKKEEQNTHTKQYI